MFSYPQMEIVSRRQVLGRTLTFRNIGVEANAAKACDVETNFVFFNALSNLVVTHIRQKRLNLSAHAVYLSMK